MTSTRFFAALLGAARRRTALMLLQAITIDDRAYEAEKASRSFANTHVFPGGCLPSQRGRSPRSSPRVTDLRRSDSRTSPPTTPRRCAAWRERFDGRRAGSRALGYDERFRRLWDFYLAPRRPASASAGSATCRCSSPSPRAAIGAHSSVETS